MKPSKLELAMFFGHSGSFSRKNGNMGTVNHGVHGYGMEVISLNVSGQHVTSKTVWLLGSSIASKHQPLFFLAFIVII